MYILSFYFYDNFSPYFFIVIFLALGPFLKLFLALGPFLKLLFIFNFILETLGWLKIEFHDFFYVVWFLG